MKRILSKILLGLLVVAVVVGGTAYFLLFRDPDANVDEVPVATHPTMIDSSGGSHMVVVDGNGTSYAVVTDADGNRYAAQYNGSEIGSTVGQINDQVALEDLPTTKNPDEQVVVTNNPNNYKGEVGTTVPAPSQQPTTVPDSSQQSPTDPLVTQAPTTDSSSSQQAPTDPSPSQQPATDPPVTDNEPVVNPSQPSDIPSTDVPATDTPGANELVPYRIDKYQKIFASGTYFMEITTNDPDLGDTPISMAIKDGDMFIDTTIEGMNCQMIFDSRKETMYLIFKDWKKYCKLPEDLMGEDFDMSSMMADFGMDDIGDVSVSTVDINGQQLIMESYISSVDGSTVNYYFNGDELVRRDNISTSGFVDSIYVSKFMSDVPDSYFEIPDGYGYLNLSWIDAFM